MDDKLKELLQEMRDVERVKTEKQKTWKKLEGEIGKSRKRSIWNYRIVLAGMSLCMLVFAFLILVKDDIPAQQSTNDDSVPNIQSVFFIDSAREDLFIARDSRLYLGVRKLDSAAYTQLEQYLEMKETMHKEHEYNKEIRSYRDLVITYSDGKVEYLKWYENGEHFLTFQDWDTKKFYAVPIVDEKDYETMWPFVKFFSKPFISQFFLLAMIIIHAGITRKLTKKYQLPKKIKMYPYTWAMVFDIFFVIITFGTMIALALSESIVMHFGWLLLLVIVHCMYHYWLDKQLPTLKGRLLIRLVGVVYGYSIVAYMFLSM